MAKLKLGIDLHNRASVFMPKQGIDYDLNRLIDLAVLCEELGFYSVSVGDSLLSKPRWRAIPTMAAMAAKHGRQTDVAARWPPRPPWPPTWPPAALAALSTLLGLWTAAYG